MVVASFHLATSWIILLLHGMHSSCSSVLWLWHPFTQKSWKFNMHMKSLLNFFLLLCFDSGPIYNRVNSSVFYVPMKAVLNVILNNYLKNPRTVLYVNVIMIFPKSLSLPGSLSLIWPFLTKYFCRLLLLP